MAAAGWDQGRIFTTAVLPPVEEPQSHGSIEQRLYDFIQGFRLVPSNEFIYRDKLRNNLLRDFNVLEVDLEHLVAYDERLAQSLKDKPSEYLPLVI